MPNAAPGLYTSWSWKKSPRTRTLRECGSSASARNFVTRSRAMTAATTPANRRRSAVLAILLFFLAVDAQPCVRQRVQPLDRDVLAAILSLAVLLGRGVEATERLVEVPEEAPLLRRHEERLLALHGVGALLGHVEGVRRQVAVGRRKGRVEALAVVAELLDRPRAFLQEPLLEMRELFLVHRPILVPRSCPPPDRLTARRARRPSSST